MIQVTNNLPSWEMGPMTKIPQHTTIAVVLLTLFNHYSMSELSFVEFHIAQAHALKMSRFSQYLSQWALQNASLSFYLNHNCDAKLELYLLRSVEPAP